MKKYLTLLFAALFAAMSFSLTSCGGDDDEPDTGNIVGTWKIVDGIADLIDCEQYYQFRNDGTCYEVLVYNDDIGGLVDKYYIEKATWSLDGNTLSISSKNTITIKKLSSNEMTIVEMGMESKLKRVSDDIVNTILKEEGY